MTEPTASERLREKDESWRDGYRTARDAVIAVFVGNEEAFRAKVEALPHAPGCPGEPGCWCPIHSVLALLDEHAE